MVYVDTAPGMAPSDAQINGDEPLPWPTSGRGEPRRSHREQELATFRERAVPEPAGVLREAIELTNDALLDVPSTVIATGYTSEDSVLREGGLRLPRRAERANADLRRPADQPLADVVAPDRAGTDLADVGQAHATSD